MHHRQAQPAVPRTSPVTSASPADWDHWNADGGPRYPHAKVVQYCFRQFPKTAHRSSVQALDLGCGGGVHTEFLAREGFDTRACDVSQTGVETTRQRLASASLDAIVECLGIDELVLAPASIDLVICIGVLECCGPTLADAGLARLASALSERARGLFVMAADDDFRVTEGTGYTLHGYTREEVSNLFTPRFSTTCIDDYITTYDGGRRRQHDWLVTVGG